MSLEGVFLFTDFSFIYEEAEELYSDKLPKVKKISTTDFDSRLFVKGEHDRCFASKCKSLFFSSLFAFITESQNKKPVLFRNGLCLQAAASTNVGAFSFAFALFKKIGTLFS